MLFAGYSRILLFEKHQRGSLVLPQGRSHLGNNLELP